MTDFRPSAFSRLIVSSGFGDVKISQSVRMAVTSGRGDVQVAENVRLILTSGRGDVTVGQSVRLVLRAASALGTLTQISQVARLVLMSSIEASNRRMSLM